MKDEYDDRQDAIRESIAGLLESAHIDETEIRWHTVDKVEPDGYMLTHERTGEFTLTVTGRQLPDPTPPRSEYPLQTVTTAAGCTVVNDSGVVLVPAHSLRSGDYARWTEQAERAETAADLVDRHQRLLDAIGDPKRLRRWVAEHNSIKLRQFARRLADAVERPQ